MLAYPRLARISVPFDKGDEVLPPPGTAPEADLSFPGALPRERDTVTGFREESLRERLSLSLARG